MAAANTVHHNWVLFAHHETKLHHANNKNLSAIFLSHSFSHFSSLRCAL